MNELTNKQISYLRFIYRYLHDVENGVYTNYLFNSRKKTIDFIQYILDHDGYEEYDRGPLNHLSKLYMEIKSTARKTPDQIAASIREKMDEEVLKKMIENADHQYLNRS